jgi:CheY-like chemotaxis protein
VNTDERFDVVLVDAQLPGIDGWQLASEISSDKSINYLKLVLLTPAGKSGDEAKMKLLHWFDAYLNKPVRLKQLREALTRIMSQAIDLEAVEADEIPKEPPSGPRVDKKIRILLAEDHVVNQELFRTILEKLGYAISVAADGMEAVALAAESPFDLIFMDVQMPRMNGLEAARALRSQNCRTPIVAVTANATKEEMQRCREAGMDDFIGKPFKKKDLLPVLERWTRRDGGESGPEPDGAGGSAAAAGPGAAEPEDREIFDFQAAVETFLGDEETVRSVLRAFREKLAADVDQLKAAHQEEDTDALSKVAHSIKGGALNLEAKRLGAAAAALEQAAGAGSGPAAEQSYGTLLAACREFAEYVASRFD